MKLISTLLVLLVLQGCDADSETTCENPNANDPVCTLDSRRLVGQPQGEGDASAQCTAAREGLVSFDPIGKGFKLCSGGRNVEISVDGTQGSQGPGGPAGPTGPQGPEGTPGSSGAAPYLSQSAVVAPGGSLTLTHNLGTNTPLAIAYFVRGGVLRPVSDYRNDIGRRTIEITGNSWGTNIRPQVLSLANGTIAVFHEVIPEQGTRAMVMDIWSDEGEPIQLAAKTFPAMSNLRAIKVSNGVLLVYELAGGVDELFTVIAYDGSTLVPPVVIGPSPGSNRVKDLKLLSNGHVVVAEQANAQASFHILDPNNGTVVASQLAVAASSDYRTVTAPVAGRFHLFFTDLASLPNARVATFANDGTPLVTPTSSGLGDETVFGSEAISVDRVAVVTSYVSNVSSTLFDADLGLVRAKTSYSPLSADGASPLALGGGKWLVCSTRSEGYCITYDRQGRELFRNGDLFKSDTAGEFSSMSAIGADGRFVVLTRNTAQNAGFMNILQSAPGRLDLQVIDANTIRVLNNTVESIPLVLGVFK